MPVNVAYGHPRWLDLLGNRNINILLVGKPQTKWLVGKTTERSRDA